METEFIVHSKVWIEDKRGNPVFGAGRHAILEAVDRLRSLQAAAKELKMSYRAVWCRIKVSEECLGKALIVRDGRGSKLTPFARELMTAFQNLQSRVRCEADAAFAEQMTNIPLTAMQTGSQFCRNAAGKQTNDCETTSYAEVSVSSAEQRRSRLM